MVALAGEDRTTFPMNTSILSKCLEELTKENPRLDYVRGMLETFIDIMNGPAWEPRTTASAAPKFVAAPMPSQHSTDEAELLDAKARASLASIKALAAQSQQ